MKRTNAQEQLQKQRELPKENQEMKYFGHIKTDNNLLKTKPEGNVEGKRLRGRQICRWEYTIREWTGTAWLSAPSAREREESGDSYTANDHIKEATR